MTLAERGSEVGTLPILTIGPASLERARAMLECLRGFEAELVESEDGRYDVQVSLDDDRDISRVLGAIDTHVTERADGPARLDLDGRHYLIEPATT
jgi:uncharacterized protein (UPF0262 family)